LTSADRLLWICLSRLWRGWRSALTIVKPETVIAWHRAGLRLFWTWKVRCGQPGRPIISLEVRALICNMCRENPSWGALLIHGELLKLGINVGESSVSKYMVRSRKPPAQTWRTLLEIHAKQLVSRDFFTVPTITTLRTTSHFGPLQFASDLRSVDTLASCEFCSPASTRVANCLTLVVRLGE
jgi:putative transposase